MAGRSGVLVLLLCACSSPDTEVSPDTGPTSAPLDAGSVTGGTSSRATACNIVGERVLVDSRPSPPKDLCISNRNVYWNEADMGKSVALEGGGVHYFFGVGCRAWGDRVIYIATSGGGQHIWDERTESQHLGYFIANAAGALDSDYAYFSVDGTANIYRFAQSSTAARESFATPGYTHSLAVSKTHVFVYDGEKRVLSGAASDDLATWETYATWAALASFAELRLFASESDVVGTTADTFVHVNVSSKIVHEISHSLFASDASFGRAIIVGARAFVPITTAGRTSVASFELDGTNVRLDEIPDATDVATDGAYVAATDAKGKITLRCAR